jgi:signal transduction histidine kinase
VNRRSTLIGSFLGLVLSFSGWLADRVLVERWASVDEVAVTEAKDTARLSAMTLRAALAEIELSVVADAIPEGVRVDRLASSPSPMPSRGPFVPYSNRSSEELVALLDSDALTPQGLPEPVVAALALEKRGAPNAAMRKETALKGLLSGLLPVNARDLPRLAERLGATKADEDRIHELRAVLESAPRTETLPRFPEFARTLSGDVVIGWSRRSDRRLHYRVPLAALMEVARVADRVQVAGPSSRTLAPVEGVAGLAVSTAPREQTTSVFHVLRFGLWAAVFVSGVGLSVVWRALRHEERAIGREKRFLANVTHELRTPLAAVRVFGESLARGRGDPVEYGELIAQETERLEALVDRVLTITRLDEAPRLVPVHPCELAEAAVELLRERARKRPARVEMRSSMGVLDALWDGDAARRALVNLLENAIGHGRVGGSVILSVEAFPDGVRFTVSDDGPGIRAQDRGRIFRRFERGDSRAPGTGLGLFMVEQVARVHGGRVDLETSPGEGCRFSLTLPFAPPGVGPDEGGVRVMA